MGSHKILVIDDSNFTPKAIQEMLPPGSVEILHAQDGAEGLKLIRQQRPSFIVLNWHLPKVSGWDIFQKIQTHPEFQKIPLVVISSLKEDITENIPEPFEYFEFVKKPIDKKTFIPAFKSAKAKAQLPRPPINQTPAPPAPVPTGEPDKLLVIDDGRAIRRLVREMLPEATYQVIEAKDGAEGVTLIRLERPNLILLDWLMPKLGGWQVYQKILAQPELQSVPLVVMSGLKEEVTEKIPEPFEYFEFLIKPFNSEELQDAIESARAKARHRMQIAALADTSGDSSVETSRADAEEIQTLKAEIQELKDKTARMQDEINGLNQKMSHLFAFIKQKLK